MYMFKYGDIVFEADVDGCREVPSLYAYKIQSHIFDFTNSVDFAELKKYVGDIVECEKAAEKYIYSIQYENASREYEKAARLLEGIGDMENAADYYAYAAITREASEKWRSISHLWYKASGRKEEVTNYQDANGLEHTYLSIPFGKWKAFSDKEKTARAMQYAAYSEDNFGGPSDSYFLYEQAVDAYEEAGNVDRMIECLISTTNRYIKQYNMVPERLIDRWKAVLNKETTLKQKELICIEFNSIYKNMNLYGSDNSLFFYLEYRKMTTRIAFANKKYLKGLIGWLWGFSSDFGTNGLKIAIRVVLMVMVLFPCLFYFANEDKSILLAICSSINAFFGIDQADNIFSASYWISVVETIYSYFVLVVIGTYLVNKMVKNMT